MKCKARSLSEGEIGDAAEVAGIWSAMNSLFFRSNPTAININKIIILFGYFIGNMSITR